MRALALVVLVSLLPAAASAAPTGPESYTPQQGFYGEPQAPAPQPFVQVEPAPAPPPPPPPGPPPYPVRNARLRLAGIQGLNAAALTAEVCVLLREDTRAGRCAPFPILIGGGVAMGLGIGVRPGISSDHVSAVNGGALLGAAHGALVLGMTRLTRPRDETSRQVGAISTMAIAQSVGTLGGHFIYRAHPSRPGVVDAATLLGTWTGLSAYMLIAGYADPTEEDAPSAFHFGTVMAALDVGIALGVLVGRATPFTPYRSLLVHGHVLTTQILAFTIAGPIYRHRDTPIREGEFWRIMGYSSLVGVMIGIGATHKARPRGGDANPLFAFDVSPVPGGALGSVHGTF